jgi:polyferredoxin
VNQLRTIAAAGKVILFVSLIVILSFFSGKIIGGKAEKAKSEKPFVIGEGMTIEQFGHENHLDRRLLNKVFELKGKGDLNKPVASFPLTQDQLVEAIARERALSEEYKSKNWILIPVKFALWIIFLGIAFIAVRKSAITATVRSVFYLIAVLAFGVILGSDPSPMGTVKDTIVLFGAKGVIFPPRLIALSLFLAMTFVANKFICAWGCQFGTLQDLVFRLAPMKGKADKKHFHPQFKLPFVFTNTVRISVFLLLSFAAFAWSLDIIHPIDPFKIYRPAMLGLAGALFVTVVLAASLFVYRPWCHMFCPFGFVSWLVEKVSIFKIKVNYDTCVACESCAKSCPSTVMDAILKRTRTIPDCFSCGTCIEACPTKSIHFLSGKRTRPPEGKLAGKA